MNDSYAIVETGGKQYMVREGDTIEVEKLDAEAGAKLEIGRVLARSDGSSLEIGRPEVKKAKVTSTVIEHIRGPKSVSFKRERRKGYCRKKGHRQDLTVLKIESLN
ncbi:MAG: 50S ribosomal protein L21 [Kiritimatiellia bacterium]